MAVIQGRTREQIRVSIGYALGKLFEGTTTSSTDAWSVLDTSLRGGNDEHIGSWIVATSGTNDGEIRQASDSATADITVTPAFGATVPSGMTYELWDRAFPPAAIHEFINMAIYDATGRFYVPDEDISLHTSKKTSRYTIPSNIAAIRRIDYRAEFTEKKLLDCDTAFDELVDGDNVVTVSTEDYREGSGSNKWVIAVGMSGTVGGTLGDIIATDSITAVDLTRYTHAEFWVKSSVAASAGDFTLMLDDTASCASAIENLAFPALTADVWTPVRVALAAPELLTAVISVGVKYVTDLAALTLHIDDIKVVSEENERWERLEQHWWNINREDRKLVISRGGLGVAPYHRLRIYGFDKPALLSTDATVTEVPEQFVIARAVAYALQSNAGGTGTDPDAHQRQAALWWQRSVDMERRFPILQDMKLVD